jgi:RHS repeat-associated protein
VYGDHNRPVSVADSSGELASYTYDGIGQRRIKALADGTRTHFHYAANGQLIAETDAGGNVIREYVYADGMRLAMATGGGSVAPPGETVIDSEDPQVLTTGNWATSTSVTGYIGASYRAHADNGPVEGGIVVDNGDPGFSTTGTWTSSTSVTGFLGADYQHHYANGTSPDAITLDNSAATAVGDWPTSTSVSGFEGADYQFQAAGTGDNSITWTSPVAPGRYKVYARWTSHPNRASNARYDIAALDAQQVPTVATVTVNQSTGSGQYQLLGEFELGDSATVTLTDAANGYVIADAIRIEPVDAAPNEATWTLTADAAAEYFLDLRWTAHPNRASDARYTIRRDGLADVVYTANQTQGAGDWTTAATLSLAAGETVTVSLSDRANGYVIADAVRLVRTDAARNRLTWPLGIEVAGEYRLEARWTSHPNRASNATYVINTSNGPQAVSVDQRQGGGVWQPLGTFTLNESSEVVITDEADGFVVADGIRVVWVDSPDNQQAISNSGSRIVYFHNDHLGTPQVITDQNQEIVWQGEYLPFGEVTTTMAAIENPMRFPGQYFDEETGTHYNYFRDFDPSLGRYLQSDPIGILRDFSDPQMQSAISMGTPSHTIGSEVGMNHIYGYVDQAPLRYIDPFGLYRGCRLMKGAQGHADYWDCGDGPDYNDGSNSALPLYTNNACVQDCIAERIKICQDIATPLRPKVNAADATVIALCVSAIVMQCSSNEANCEDKCEN